MTTKGEIAWATIDHLLEDPNAMAINVTDVVKEMEKNGVGVSKSVVEGVFRNAYNNGKLEYKITSKGRCFRFCNTENPFPPEYNEIIFDAVKAINEETKRPATTSQIMEKIGDILERSSVNVRLKSMVYKTGVLRFEGNYGRLGTHAYYVNSNDCCAAMESLRKKNPYKPPEKKFEEFVVEKLGGYWTRDLTEARKMTHVGDKVELLVQKMGSKENRDPEPVTLTVAEIYPHICVFDNGMSVPWIDFAAMYRGGKKIKLTLY